MGAQHVGVVVQGFSFGLSLIVAIGAQNAFVLKQGIRRDHVAAVVALCVLVDATLISVGVAGFGTLVARAQWALTAARVGGAAFLVWYGVSSLRAALHPGVLAAPSDDATGGTPRTGRLASVVVSTLAVSLLNPHVYLDTVVLLGSIAAQHPAPDRLAFGLGAATASLVWFTTLGFGARVLAPLFARPNAWRVLDLFIACVMFWIASGLIAGLAR